MLWLTKWFPHSSVYILHMAIRKLGRIIIFLVQKFIRPWSWPGFNARLLAKLFQDKYSFLFGLDRAPWWSKNFSYLLHARTEVKVYRYICAKSNFYLYIANNFLWCNRDWCFFRLFSQASLWSIEKWVKEAKMLGWTLFVGIWRLTGRVRTMHESVRVIPMDFPQTRMHKPKALFRVCVGLLMVWPSPWLGQLAIWSAV